VTSKPRAVAVVRVSAQGDRAEEHFHSPDVQLDSAKRWARKRRERFVARFPEIDVSGKRPLVKRPGLLKAVEMVETGQADHIVVAYFDRLVRSLKVQLEVIERVENAGGEIFALDHGKLTNGTAATRLSTNMMGAVFQYFAEVTGEKVTAAQARAVARGVLPNSRIVPGYMRGQDGVLLVVPELAPVVREVFERRDRGATIVELQAFLLERGIERRSPAWRRCCARGCTSARSISASCTTPTLTSRSSPIAPCLSACSGGRSRAGAKPSPSGCWRASVCCAAGPAPRGW
jgi:site-specific DNA recombinase